MGQCEVGNDWRHVWCHPCRVAQKCMRFKPMPGPDVFTFQPLTGKRLTPAQRDALALLRMSPGYSTAIEVCDRYAVLLGLWRRGLARCNEMCPHLSPMTQLWEARPE